MRQLTDPAAVDPGEAAGYALVVIGGGRRGVRGATAVAGLRQAGVIAPALILANSPDRPAEELARTDPTVRVLYKIFLPSEFAAVVGELVGPRSP